MITAIQTVEPQDIPELRSFMERVMRSERVFDDLSLQAELVHNVNQNLDWWSMNSDECCHLKFIQDGQIAGVVLVKNFWNLCSLFVAPELHRQGIGRQLVAAAIQHCRNFTDRSSIRLNAAPNAVVFYEAIGFLPASSTRILPPGFRAMEFHL
jgi:GNAT superfamily N-acetyltransferase